MTKQEATDKGKALLKQMEGKGWTLRVWENVGWHFSVYNRLIPRGNLTIYPPSGSVYWCALSLWSDLGGEYRFDRKSHGKDPNKLVRDVLDYAERLLATEADCVAVLRRKMRGAERGIKLSAVPRKPHARRGKSTGWAHSSAVRAGDS